VDRPRSGPAFGGTAPTGHRPRIENLPPGDRGGVQWEPPADSRAAHGPIIPQIGPRLNTQFLKGNRIWNRIASGGILSANRRFDVEGASTSALRGRTLGPRSGCSFQPEAGVGSLMRPYAMALPVPLVIAHISNSGHIDRQDPTANNEVRGQEPICRFFALFAHSAVSSGQPPTSSW
jgi:hypothetical protein